MPAPSSRSTSSSTSLCSTSICQRRREGLPTRILRAEFRILSLCEQRDGYPIPAVLVHTGYLQLTQETALRERLRRSFAYGETLTKGKSVEELAHEVSRALERVRSYTDVGIHLRDGGMKMWPTLSPREDDLLRRTALKAVADGVDLAWWTAEPGRSTAPVEYQGWTKVLYGHLLLGKSGLSRGKFFKFAPAALSASLDGDTRLIAEKLPHVKCTDCVTTGGRVLLTTETVSASTTPPVPLSRFVATATPESVAQHAEALVGDVLKQLDMLGEVRRPNSTPFGDLLFDGHSAEQLTLALQRSTPEKGELEELFGDPIDVLKTIRTNRRPVRYMVRDCVHGDLHAQNIAVGFEPSRPQAYVFDAAGLRITSAAEEPRGA